MDIFNLEKQIPSGHKVEPRCLYFGKCGGCQLQHWDYPGQLILKEKYLKEILDPLIALDKIRSIIPSPKIWNYRRRIQVHATPRGEVGFFAANSPKVVPIENCPITEESINQALPELRDRVAQDLKLKERPARLSYELTLLEDGKVEMSRAGEERFFLQNNPGANQELINLLQKEMQKIPAVGVLELFAGVGNFTYALAQAGKNWIAVESHEPAYREGMGKQKGSKLSIQWVCQEAHRYLKKKKKKSAEYPLVLLDPPREGARECLKGLMAWQPKYIFYVSCSPESLRQDLKVLLEEKYKVEWVQGLDFFPQTSHLESLTFLTLR